MKHAEKETRGLAMISMLDYVYVAGYWEACNVIVLCGCWTKPLDYE